MIWVIRNGKGKWENGKMGKWENGKMGIITTQVYNYFTMTLFPSD
jgi:aminopeptidase C